MFTLQAKGTHNRFLYWANVAQLSFEQHKSRDSFVLKV